MEKQTYKFKLYVVKKSPQSIELVNKIKSFFNLAIKDDYTLEVIDVLANPELAVNDRVLASPTLIMEIPSPQKRAVGTIDEKILLSLDLFSTGGN